MKKEQDTPMTFDSLRQKIRDKFQDLSPHLQRIARSSLDEPNAFALSTTAKIAESLDVQPSTLIRFSKEFGYSGFSELQKVFQQRLIEGEPTTREQVLSDTTAGPKEIQDVFDSVIEVSIASLERLRNDTNISDVVLAVNMMREAQHIYVAGLRRSRPVADYLVYGLLRTEKPSSLLDFAGGMSGPQISTVSSSDVLIAIAFSPYATPVVNAAMDAHVSGKRIIAITDNPDSPIAKIAQVTLYAHADTKTPMQPMSGPMGLIQALLVLVGQE